MPARHRTECLLWQHFLYDPTGTVIVLPSPHGACRHGISHHDACAMAEVYARFQSCIPLDVTSPDQLDADIKKNLILIGGPKANTVTRDLYATQGMHVTFGFENGVIYDRDQQVMATSHYLEGATRTIEHLIVDYGLILYMNNPFGHNTKILLLAGIHGCGTLAAAIAVTENSSLQLIAQRLATRPNPLACPTSEHLSVEILVKVSATQTKVERQTLSIEKLTVHHRSSGWHWASESYQELQPVSPYRISVTFSKMVDSSPSLPTITIDDQELRWARSPDRRNLLACLTKHTREDYFTGAEANEWVLASVLVMEIWPLTPETGMTALSPELRRDIADSILTWGRHLRKQGQLKLDERILFDHEYINKEILIFDHDLKKRLTDLVYVINHEAKEILGSDFQLIASQHGKGYRLNLHPALITISSPESV